MWSELNVYSDCIKECHNDFSGSLSFFCKNGGVRIHISNKYMQNKKRNKYRDLLKLSLGHGRFVVRFQAIQIYVISLLAQLYHKLYALQFLKRSFYKCFLIYFYSELFLFRVPFVYPSVIQCITKNENYVINHGNQCTFRKYSIFKKI